MCGSYEQHGFTPHYVEPLTQSTEFPRWVESIILRQHRIRCVQIHPFCMYFASIRPGLLRPPYREKTFLRCMH
jgi:hypothetical protein